MFCLNIIFRLDNEEVFTVQQEEIDQHRKKEILGIFKNYYFLNTV